MKIFIEVKMAIADFFKWVKFISRLNEEYITNLIDEMKYELADDLQKLPIPKIKTIDETIDDLLALHSSICRFGDGEINLINGRDIPFQKYSDGLKNRLLEVLTSDRKDLLIAIPRICFYSKKNITASNKHFWRKKGNRFREIILPHLNMDRQYWAAELTLAYSYFQEYDFEMYFSKLRQVWQNKEVVVICGDKVFDKIKNNIFDNAALVEYQYAPSINAYENYGNILKQALMIDKNKLVVVILGPTAKVLAYDMTVKGYHVLDLGHVAKSYDLYIKKSNNHQMNRKFYNPD